MTFMTVAAYRVAGSANETENARRIAPFGPGRSLLGVGK
jgi:hypothetical protein